MNKIKINKNGFWESNDETGHCFDTSLCNSIREIVSNKNVLDLGCGTGAYTKSLLPSCKSIKGYDGNPNTKKISNGLCDVADLTKIQNFSPVDWVICLEVGEHVPKEFENVLLKNICDSCTEGAIISWAVPMQPGDGHINCQSNDYIIEKMKNQGFAINYKLSSILRNSSELWWFKNTIMVFEKIKMPKITFCIPSKNNLRYLKACIPSIRKNSYRNDHDISIFVDKDEDGTVEWLNQNKEKYNLTIYINPNLNKSLFGIGMAYDYLIKNSTTDIFMVFHADMMLAKNADYHAFKYLTSPKKVVCSTRIEPPLHPEGKEKIVKNFGLWPEKSITDGFLETEFDKFVEEQQCISFGTFTNGCFAPWMMYKKNFIDMGMHDPIMKSAREDSDVFNRMVLNNYDLIQSWDSFVYHLTCRGGQFEHGVLTKEHSQKSKDWQKLMFESTLEFIRKWGQSVLHDDYLFPIIKNKYNIGIVIKNCNRQLLELLEPWCSNIYVDCKYDDYISEKQSGTSFNLNERIKPINNKIENGIVVTFDGNFFNSQEKYVFLTELLSDIIKETNELGTFEYDIFNIQINNLQKITIK